MLGKFVSSACSYTDLKKLRSLTRLMRFCNEEMASRDSTRDAQKIAYDIKLRAYHIGEYIIDKNQGDSTEGSRGQ